MWGKLIMTSNFNESNDNQENNNEKEEVKEILFSMDLDLIAFSNQALLFILKIFGLTTISWIVVFSPLYIWILLVFVFHNFFEEI